MFFDDLNNSDFRYDIDLFTISEGFNAGNMFRNEYEGYKSYKYGKLTARNDKEKLLLCIYEYDFALNDLALYLDLHPEDITMYNFFKKVNDEKKYYVDIYEEKYGPLELCSSDYSGYEWVDGPWPFEGVDINV